MPNLTSRSIAMLLLAVALFALTGCEQSNKPLTVARHIWPGYEFVYLAESLGHLEPGKVTFVQTESAPETVALLREGKVDGGALTLDEVLRAYDEGITLVVVLVFDISAGADMLLARPEIADLPSLRGKRIGVETGAVGAVMFDRVLDAAGLNVEQVELIPMQLQDHISAWEQNRLDAVICFEPHATMLKDRGAVELFSSREAPNLIVDVLAFRPEALEKEAAIQHLVDEHFNAQRHFIINPNDAYYRLSPRLGVAVEEVSDLYEGLVLPGRENNLRLLYGGSATLKTDVKNLAAILHNAGLIQSVDVPETLFDDRFVARGVQ
jgi:NitT/TauT family transport system substrate-binding protein